MAMFKACDSEIHAAEMLFSKSKLLMANGSNSVLVKVQNTKFKSRYSGLIFCTWSCYLKLLIMVNLVLVAESCTVAITDR